MDNKDVRWREIRRFVLEFKALYFFLNSSIWSFLFEKSNLRIQRNNTVNTLNLDCKEVQDQFLGKLRFSKKLQKMYGKIEVF